MASSLSAFLETMYKKRELEYKAALEQSKADVAGAEAIGGAIGKMGSAVGSIGQGIGGYMQQSASDKSAMAIAAEEGHPLTSTGFGAEAELKQRMAVGQFKDNSITPYQSAQLAQGDRRLNLAVGEADRRRQADLDRKAGLTTKEASKSYQESIKNYDAYQSSTAANMANLYKADSAEVFETHKKRQEALNFGAARAGVPEDQLQQIPSEWIPPSNQASYGLYKEEQRFGQGQSNPAAMRQARQGVEAEQAKTPATYDEKGNIVQPPAAPRYGSGPGDLRPPTYSTGVNIPAGAIPAPNFPGKPGAEAEMNGKPYVWDGNFFVPKR